VVKSLKELTSYDSHLLFQAHKNISYFESKKDKLLRYKVFREMVNVYKKENYDVKSYMGKKRW